MDEPHLTRTETRTPMGKQETFYRIQISLTERDYTKKRLQFLEKTNFLQSTLKTLGHSGRYGLKPMYCYATRPRWGYCITSIEHDKDIPWLRDAIEQVRQFHKEEIQKQHEEIDAAIEKYKGWKSEKRKQDFIDEEFDFQGLGVDKKNVDTNSFISVLQQAKYNKPLYNEEDYLIDELFIEPFKPTKKEQDIEDTYLSGLSQSSQGQLNKSLMERFAPKTLSKRPQEITTGESDEERIKRLKETIQKNFDNL